MTPKRLMFLLKDLLCDHFAIQSIKGTHYVGGASLHILAEDGRKIRILIEENG